MVVTVALVVPVVLLELAATAVTVAHLPTSTLVAARLVAVVVAALQVAPVAPVVPVVLAVPRSGSTQLVAAARLSLQRLPRWAPQVLVAPLAQPVQVEQPVRVVPLARPTQPTAMAWPARLAQLVAAVQRVTLVVPVHAQCACTPTTLP
jgi:hypothetical protein